MDPWDDDVTHVLAELLATPADILVEQIGGGWRRVPASDTDEPPDRTWFVSGHPPQVMIGVGRADVCVAEAAAQWYGHLPELAPGAILTIHDRTTALAAATLSAAVGEAEQRRRATFRYCRYCRRLVAPEHLFSEDTCHICATRFQGVVY